jgi:hypothetical protein
MVTKVVFVFFFCFFLISKSSKTVEPVESEKRKILIKQNTVIKSDQQIYTIVKRKHNILLNNTL